MQMNPDAKSSFQSCSHLQRHCEPCTIGSLSRLWQRPGSAADVTSDVSETSTHHGHMLMYEGMLVMLAQAEDTQRRAADLGERLQGLQAANAELLKEARKV